MKKTIPILLFIASSYNLFGQAIFTEASAEAGINHIFNIYQGTFGGGVVVFDMNNDGYEDLFLAGGIDNNKLYLNNQNGTFSDVTLNSGIDVLNGFITQGGASADIDKDGFSDLVITTIAESNENQFEEGHDFVLINNGNNTFTDATLSYGLLDIKTSAASASFGDFNKDGFVDLYITGYFKDYKGRLDEYDGNSFQNGVFTGGGSGGPDRDYLYLNQNGESFVEVSEAYGMVHRGFGFSAVWSDFDNDNDLDLLVANDFGDSATGNLLYRNNYPQKSFANISDELNFGYRINGMGIGVGDYNFDGLMDYYVTNIRRDPFLEGKLGKPFAEISEIVNTATDLVFTDAGIGAPKITWGVNFFDADNDTDLDLFTANGCLNPNIAPNPNLLFENVGGSFLESGFIANINDPSIGRGSVTFDYDRDGDLDLLVINQKPFAESKTSEDFKGTRLYRNDTTNDNNWLVIDLKGVRSELNGIGSRVEVYIGDKILIREVDGGSSHMSQNSSAVHFGLGETAVVDKLVVKWTNSPPQTLENISPNQILTLEESQQEIPENEVSAILYPIPYVEELNILLKEVDPELPVEISVFDVKGQLVYARQIEVANGPAFKIAPLLNQGVYLVEIAQGGMVIRKKILR